MLEPRSKVGPLLLASVLGLSVLHCESGGASGEDDGDAVGAGGSGNASGSGGSGDASGSGGASGGTGGASAGTGGATGGTGGTSAGTGGTAAGSGGSSAGTGSSDCANPVPVAIRGAAPAPLDEAAFTAQWPALVCAAMKPGCDAASVAYDEAACMAYAATVLDDELAYDAVEAADCVVALREATYSSSTGTSYLGLPAPCYYVYRGDIAVGAACEDDSECAPDPRGPVRCDFTTQICTVLVRGKLGEACNEGCELETDDGSCYPSDPDVPGVEITCHNEDGLYCESATRTCKPSIPIGCSCFLGASQYCNADSDCTDGIGAVCIPRVEAGAPCRSNSDCVRATYCPFADGSVCTARKHAGEACDEHDQCMGSYCMDGACVPDSGVTRGGFDDAYCSGT